MTRCRGGLGLLLVALAALRAGSARAEQVLYGITNSNVLITIDTTTAVGTLVGPLSSMMNPNGIAFRGNKLYTWDAVVNRLRQLDIATAATLNTIDIGATGGGGDIDFRSDGIGFLALTPPPGLIRCDITVPNSTVVAPLTLFVAGLAFNSAGVLYGAGNQLYTIDQTTAVETPVSPAFLPLSVGGGIAFDANDNLFGALQVGGVSQLYQIDAATGTATLIGTIGGFPGITGIRFQPLPPAPPPPAPASAGSEGSFVEASDPPYAGSEGGFGFGAHLAIQTNQGLQPTRARPLPVLVGPFLDSPGVGLGLVPVSPELAALPPTGASLRVFNALHKQKTQPGSQQGTGAGNGALGWALFAGLGLAAMLVLASTIAAPFGATADSANG